VPLFRGGEHLHALKRHREMKRRGEQACLHDVDLTSPLGASPEQPSMPVNVVDDAQAIVQVDEVRAAAQQHVLAVVDDLGALIGRRYGIGGRTAA
jgi:hypothetical protein